MILELSVAAEIWLARALVSEAGWQIRGDHYAIPHVLRRRQRIRGDRSIIRTIRAYCVGLKRGAKPTYRRRWVLRLPRLPSRRYRGSWRRVRAIARRFGAGNLVDPCPDAIHWAAPSVRKSWPRVDCGDTVNVFYGR